MPFLKNILLTVIIEDIEVLKTDTRILLINRTSLLTFLSFIVLCACTKEKKELRVQGRWVNISLTDINSPFIYDFRSGGNVYTKYLNGKISERAWKLLDGNVLISSDSNSSYLSEFEIYKNGNDSLIISEVNKEPLTLLQISSVNSRYVDEAVLSTILMDKSWKLFVGENDSPIDHEIEFYQNHKYLDSYISGDSTTRSIVHNWDIHDVDSMSFLSLKNFGLNMVFFDKIDKKNISGRLYNSNGKGHYFEMQKVDAKIDFGAKEMIKGSWEIKEEPEMANVPVNMTFELEDGYMGYYMYNRDNSFNLMGDWDLSKNGKTIVLDYGKDLNKSVINIVEVNKTTLTILYCNQKLIYTKE